ncbi:hypothetical protein LVJ85_05730 [Neisseria sp. Dent CA1/247]|uniref:hypothetical protein n=1 Tax=Neisseria sp. Dent CA1/247 TaxID=2912675 RepID=UPI001FD4BB6D|nr:hypothetical protein [Neisseria sp. Dent CA1/247]UOO77962.1 hypothetical protein LVJ85_05730 [Neisseria sp. Dent CA1/247]
MKQRFQTALCLYIAVMFFGMAVIMGKSCAHDAHQEIRTAYQQNDTAALISAAESRAIVDVIQAEKQYEHMDYQFFNGDAEAYPTEAEK